MCRSTQSHSPKRQLVTRVFVVWLLRLPPKAGWQPTLAYVCCCFLHLYVLAGTSKLWHSRFVIGFCVSHQMCLLAAVQSQVDCHTPVCTRRHFKLWEDQRRNYEIERSFNAIDGELS